MGVLIVVVLIVFVIITNNLKSGAYGRMFYDCTKSQYSLLLDLDCEPFVYLSIMVMIAFISIVNRTVSFMITTAG